MLTETEIQKAVHAEILRLKKEMSYSIIAKAKNGSIKEIPISTNDFFHEYWQPLFEKHKMVNLCNWKFPHDFEEDEFKEIIKEWGNILKYIESEWESERANFILNQLKLIRFKDYEYINFG
ncbi:hypothetical protein JI747_007155 [Chryseobacterium sp. RG1]|uniref:Group-specific protein n=1 Tax=Chryseobacterium tagetis TaxID=2801334 RepID=A0ABS7ZYZ6_9FLAO|nr:hypothetical protein [Chryseobacterium tagetis]MCA6066949.1 hypothetical protein [Chryseobacterium tagetis]